MVGDIFESGFKSSDGIGVSQVRNDRGNRFQNTDHAKAASIETVEQDVTKLLNTRLCAATGLQNLGLPKNSFGELIAAYNAGWSSLETCKSEWIRFLSGIPLIDVAVDDSGRLGNIDQMSKKAQQEWKQDLLRGLLWPAEIAQSGVSARLSVLPLSDAQNILADDLSTKIQLIAFRMATHLSLFVERKVCGLIEWYGPNACKYKFYVRQIKSFELEDQQTSWIERTEGSLEAIEKTQHTGKHEKTISWHIHEIVNAIEVHPLNTSMCIPQTRLPIVESIPGWLNGLVKIVEGSLVREIQVVEDCESETWNEVKERPVTLQPDPAIVMGSYVLASSAEFVGGFWLRKVP